MAAQTTRIAAQTATSVDHAIALMDAEQPDYGDTRVGSVAKTGPQTAAGAAWITAWSAPHIAVPWPNCIPSRMVDVA
jgi:hypothetical protein